ncbi:MAG: prolipoprotein diacylglyceryl transferase [Microbacteriaceae bacterium]|nr:prolipoprotein diacylglyceryl transferase [Microbacteriaceae bacterium]
MIPEPTISNFQVGPFVIHFYALLILLGIIVATIWTSARMKKRGMDPGLAIDIAIWAVPFGIIGGRAFHVLTHIEDYFGPGKNWQDVFKIWEGGLAIYGALIFGAIGAYIACQVDIKPLRIRSAGIRFFSFADALVPGLLAAQAIGRWGNYFNRELFGEPTDLPWGLYVSPANPSYPLGFDTLIRDEPLLFHPTFLYESLWSILGIVALLLLERRFNLRWGKLFSLYLIWYGIGRFFIESIRMDSADVFLGLRTNQWSALVGVLIGLLIYVLQTSRHTGIETTGYLPGRSWEPQEKKAKKTDKTEPEVETVVESKPDPE